MMTTEDGITWKFTEALLKDLDSVLNVGAWVGEINAIGDTVDVLLPPIYVVADTDSKANTRGGHLVNVEINQEIVIPTENLCVISAYVLDCICEKRNPVISGQKQNNPRVIGRIVSVNGNWSFIYATY